jgi:hypothetical protein
VEPSEVISSEAEKVRRLDEYGLKADGESLSGGGLNVDVYFSTPLEMTTMILHYDVISRSRESAEIGLCGLNEIVEPSEVISSEVEKARRLDVYGQMLMVSRCQAES